MLSVWRNPIVYRGSAMGGNLPSIIVDSQVLTTVQSVSTRQIVGHLINPSKFLLTALNVS
jgi:hypothetical protein